jgi:DNA-binding NarL/FixJ family response regulator
MTTRVLIVEDHPCLRSGIADLLREQPGLEVVAAVGSGKEALTCCRRLRPDVVVMDVVLPDANGMEITDRIVGESPAIKVVALSMHSDRRYVNGMLESAAAGYVLKDGAFEELASAIDTVMAGGIYLSPSLR